MGEVYLRDDPRARRSIGARRRLRECYYVQQVLMSFEVEELHFVFYDEVALVNTVDIVKAPWCFVELLRQLVKAFGFIHRNGVRECKEFLL